VKERRRGQGGHRLSGVCTGDERRKKGLTRRGWAVGECGCGASCQRLRKRRRVGEPSCWAYAVTSASTREGKEWAYACGWAIGPAERGEEQAREGWTDRRESRGKGFFSFFFHFYFVFKTKFNYEPNANPNIVSNILFKMRTFGRFPKLNFCKLLKTLLFSNSIFLFFYFKTIFKFIIKSNLNYF